MTITGYFRLLASEAQKSFPDGIGNFVGPETIHVETPYRSPLFLRIQEEHAKAKMARTRLVWMGWHSQKSYT